MKLFGQKNLLILAIGLFLLLLGYIFLGQGPVKSLSSWYIAPIILVAVYCIIIPVGILIGFKDEEDNKGA